MKEKTKVETFIGFSIKSRKCKMGVNAICTLKKANLLICCKSASENTICDAMKLAKRFNCKLIRSTEYELSEYVKKDNIKLIAITDFNLSQAIFENKEKEFIVIEREI